MIKEKLGHRVDDVVHTLFPFLFKRAINPDWLTVGGAIVAAASAVAYAMGEFRLAGFVLFASGLFDLVDGVVARHFKISTTFGGFLDSTLDRFVDMAVMLGIIIYFSSVGELWLSVLSGYVLVCTVLTSYAKARAELHLEHLPGGMLERGERMGLLVAGSVFGFVPIAMYALALGTTYTVAQRLIAAQREMATLDRATSPETEAV